MSTEPMTPDISSIRQRVLDGQRLSPDEATRLFQPDVDPHVVGQMADLVRQRKNGDVVYYNINAHLNPTNVCMYRCPLCAYSCDANDHRAYVMRIEQIVKRGQEAVEDHATELHIVGGVHPDMPYTWYREILRTLHASFPSLGLKAWTAVEIARFSELSGMSVGRVLEDLISSGLTSLPGGGAEIFSTDVRRRICPKKADADAWLDVHRTAHRLGLRSNATMLYGHIESIDDRVDHLIRLRTLQDETSGFQAFIPLAFHPDGTGLSDLRKPTALEDLRVMAVSRLVLDNFPHMKAYWISLGVGTAQTALCYGADDLDGTVRHERIHHEAGSKAPEVLSAEELCGLIREAGREPIERNTLYQHVRRP